MTERSVKEEAAVTASAIDEESTVLFSEEPTVVVELPADPHRVEMDVRQRLLQAPNLHFCSLVIRRVRNGVCLEGVLETDEECPDVCGLVRQVTGVEEVLNHLVIRNLRWPPAKG